NGGHNPLSSSSFSIKFNIYSDSSYTYAEKADETSSVRTATAVGNMTISFSLKSAQSFDDAVTAVTNLLNGNTVIDLASSGAGADSFSLGAPSIGDGKVSFNVNVESDEEWYGLNIQSGTESKTAENVITIRYMCLNNDRIGISDLDCSDEDNSRKAIEKIKNAMQIVNGQRIIFGVDSNRLLSARKNNENTMINTQNAESKIRDTDMAAEMVKKARNDILRQAGYSILTQATKNPEKILELLSG
ncbi:MAG: hypothetical protein K5894_08450, partial [Lachnospiraceae bacterium]|nr:hypothetical protein [Lachnospiraceae bacterium]